MGRHPRTYPRQASLPVLFYSLVITYSDLLILLPPNRKYSEGHEYEGTEPIKVMNSNDWQELESPQDIIGRVVCITDVEEDDNSNSTAPRIIVSSRRWYNKREGKDLKGPHKDKCTNIRRLKFDQLLMKVSICNLITLKKAKTRSYTLKKKKYSAQRLFSNYSRRKRRNEACHSQLPEARLKSR